MKNYLTILTIIIISWNSVLADSEKNINASLKHITVYPDRAQLSHETTVDIPAGNTILKLSGLSPYIDARSIQVKGSGNFTILSVNHQNNYLINLEDSPEIKDIRKQIEVLQLKWRRKPQ